jgi:Domain of unknown function (DUF4939)/Zinc knuckle
MSESGRSDTVKSPTPRAPTPGSKTLGKTPIKASVKVVATPSKPPVTKAVTPVKVTPPTPAKVPIVVAKKPEPVKEESSEGESEEDEAPPTRQGTDSFDIVDPTPPENPDSPDDSGTDNEDEMADTYARAKVNTPEQFHGVRGKLSAFIVQSGLYIYWNPKEFPNEEREIMFMISYMRGNAYNWIHARVEEYMLKGKVAASAELQRLFNSKEYFLYELKTVFGDVDEKRQADRDLNALSQRTSAANYSAEFHRLASMLTWDNAALMSRYYQGLKFAVKEEISMKETQPTNLADMIHMSIKIDQRQYEMSLEKRGQGGYQRGNGKKKNYGNPKGFYGGPMPMELDKLQPGRQQRRGGPKQKKAAPKGNCYNCGKPGHYSNKCRGPKNPNAGPPGQRREVIRTLTEKNPKERKSPKEVISMMNEAPDEDWTWGPNQRATNFAAVRNILRDNKAVAYMSNHKDHYTLPMSECKVDKCYRWEHIDRKDPGEPTWKFPRHEPTRRLGNTQLRRVLAIPNICKNGAHGNHRYIPENMCQVPFCTYNEHNQFMPKGNWNIHRVTRGVTAHPTWKPIQNRRGEIALYVTPKEPAEGPSPGTVQGSSTPAPVMQGFGTRRPAKSFTEMMGKTESNPIQTGESDTDSDLESSEAEDELALITPTKEQRMEPMVFSSTKNPGKEPASSSPLGKRPYDIPFPPENPFKNTNYWLKEVGKKVEALKEQHPVPEPLEWWNKKNQARLPSMRQPRTLTDHEVLNLTHDAKRQVEAENLSKELSFKIRDLLETFAGIDKNFHAFESVFADMRVHASWDYDPMREGRQLVFFMRSLGDPYTLVESDDEPAEAGSEFENPGKE